MVNTQPPLPATRPSEHSEQSPGDVVPAVPDLADELRTAVMRTSRRLRHEASSDVVTPGQNSVLGLLSKRGPQTPRQLADAEHIQAPSMTRTLNALESAGLVRRSEHPHDGRQVLLELTDQGRSVLEESRQKRSAWFAGRLKTLGPEELAALHRAAELLLEMSAK